MFPVQNYSVKGNFVFKIYDSNHNLKQTVGPVENFITSMGLGFPANFAFADCFRYISLGTGNAPNCLTGNGSIWGTTGLNKPHPDHQYIGGRTAYSDPDGSLSNYDLQGCSFKEHSSGVTLSRSWRVPRGGANFDQDITFKEYMVSPGQPSFVSGYSDSDGFASLRCACAADDVTSAPQLYQSQDYFSPQVFGPEHSALGGYYKTPSICEAYQAFSRIVTDITAAAGDSITATYNLNINYATGAKLFSVTPHSENSNWSGSVMGNCGQIHHGLMLINDNSSLTSSNSVLGPGNLYITPWNTYEGPVYELGESFVPPWGAPMEPSRTGQLLAGGNFNNILGYISTDNLQFAINSADGGSIIAGGPTSSGVMAWKSTPSTSIDPDASKWYNIRQNSGLANYADFADYHTTVSAQDINFPVVCKQQDLIQFSGFTPPSSAPQCSGRSRNTAFSMEFWGNTNDANGNMPMQGQIKALTLAYRDASQDSSFYKLNDPSYPLTTIPFFDAVFASSGVGRAILPAIVGSTYNTGNQNGYFYLPINGKLTVQFIRSWSSDCPSSVSGCPGFVG
jgi:hypothetical protein